jgi:hypothetical protein
METRKGERQNEIETLRKLVDMAIDCNQMVVLRADMLSQTLERGKLSEVSKIREDAIRSSHFLLKMERVLIRRKEPIEDLTNLTALDSPDGAVEFKTV